MQIIKEYMRTIERTKELIDRYTDEQIDAIITHDTDRIEVLNETLFCVANYLPRREYLDFLKHMQKLIEKEIKCLEYWG